MIHFIDHLSFALMFIEKAVLSLLIFLGFAVVGVFAWRLRAYRIMQADTLRWIKVLSHDMDVAMPSINLTAQDMATIAGRVLRTGLTNLRLAPEALEKVFKVQEYAEKRNMESGLAFLGTVGSNAPFLGLTGTVIGILVAFQKFAASGGKGSTEVMLAISHALVATAIGLIVAIPAVVCYNILRERSRTILGQAQEIQGMILARSLHKAYSGLEV